MIGHRLGHLNFTLYRKQRGPPNNGVNVNDAGFRGCRFRRTRELNDNDIPGRRLAKYLRPRAPEHLFLFLLPFSLPTTIFSTIPYPLSSAGVYADSISVHPSLVPMRFLFCKNPR